MADYSLEGINLSLNEVDLDICIICQGKSDGNLTSEKNGRDKIIDASAKLNDDLLVTINENRFEYINYHMKCYRSYIRKRDRVVKQSHNDNSNVAPVNSNETSTSKSKRFKRDTKSVSGSSSSNICIICNKHKHKKDKNTFRICDIIKHEKLQLGNYLLEFCEINYDSEYDLHHESSPTITEKDEMMVNHMTNYIFERRNPFTLQQTKELKNLVTEKHFTEQEINFSFECLTIGSKASTDFVEDRLNKKSKRLFDTLSRNWKRPKKPVDSKEKDVRKETMQFVKMLTLHELENIIFINFHHSKCVKPLSF